jgi:hypothetical protein
MTSQAWSLRGPLIPIGLGLGLLLGSAAFVATHADEAPPVSGLSGRWAHALVFEGSNYTEALTIDADGKITGDFGLLVKCASKPFPAAVDTEAASADAAMLSKMAEQWFHEINACREILLGYQAGWRAAGGKGQPYNVPLSRDDDFKRNIECDIDKKTMHISCNVDKW